MGEPKGQVVVVGVDFQAGADAGIVAGLRMLKTGGASKLHLFHVLDPRDVIGAIETPALQTEEQVLEHAPGILRDRTRELASLHGLTYDEGAVVTHARIGTAVETLLQAAVDYDADLLIVGTHGRRGLERLVLGSVAEALVRKARCPVLVAREKDYTGCERTKLPDPPGRGEAPRKKPGIDVTDHTVSTEAAGWNPSGSLPTGFRIV